MEFKIQFTVAKFIRHPVACNILDINNCGSTRVFFIFKIVSLSLVPALVGLEHEQWSETVSAALKFLAMEAINP